MKHQTSEVHLRLSAIIFMLLLSVMSYGRKIYVSCNGSDSNTGTSLSPLKTIGGLQRFLSTVKDRNITVIFMEGRYECFRTFVVPTRFSSFTMKAAKANRIGITGSKTVAASSFQSVSDSFVIQRLRPEARGKVKVCNLKAQGITDYGDYFTPPPYGAHPHTPSHPLQLMVNGGTMPIARYPDEDWMKVGKVSDRGAISKIDGFKEPKDTTNRGGSFAYFDDEPKRWTHAEDVWLSGFFYWGWCREQVRVSEIDTLKHEFHLASALVYGIGAADNDEPEGMKAGSLSEVRRYYAFNLLEEISRPGEWYLDGSAGFLYWWPVDGYEKKDISVTVADRPFIVGEDVSNVTVSGFDFYGGKAGAVTLTGGGGNRIQSCSFTGFREAAVIIKGSGNRVENCSFDDVNGAVVAEGGDRKTLRSGGIVITDCLFSRFNNAAVRLQGVGTEISHCEFRDADNSAINFNGNDHVIEYNIFDSLFTNIGDDRNVVGMGRNPSYQGSEIRYNLFSNIGKEPNSCQSVYIDDGSCGTRVFGNIFYRAGSGKNACVYTNGGSYNCFENNIFIDNPIAYHLGNCFHWWAKERLVNYLAPDGDFTIALTKDVDIKSPIWRKRYPLLTNYFDDDPATPKGNVFRNNAVINSNTAVKGNRIEENVRRVQSRLTEDNYVVSGLNHTFGEWKRILSDGSFQKSVRQKLPEFRKIPFSEIGKRSQTEVESKVLRSY